MVAPRSFLPPGIVDQIQGLKRRGFATQLALVGVVIRLVRDGAYVGDPTPVVVTFANRQAADVRSGIGAAASFSEGTVEAYASWEVREGDVFRLGDVDATVTGVEPIASGGTVTASFEVGRSSYGS